MCSKEKHALRVAGEGFFGDPQLQWSIGHRKSQHACPFSWGNPPSFSCLLADVCEILSCSQNVTRNHENLPGFFLCLVEVSTVLMCLGPLQTHMLYMCEYMH